MPMTRKMTAAMPMMLDARIVMQAEERVGEVYLYDDIKADEYDFWTGETVVSETSEKFIRDKLTELAGVDRLDIHISSRGGYVQVGLNLYTQLKAFECGKKTVYIDGLAGSIATVIAMAGDEIIMDSTGLMMIHNASVYPMQSMNSVQLRKTADDLDIITSAGKTAYLEHSGGKITEEKLTELMDAETYLTAAQCLEYGLCDRISRKGAAQNGAPEQYMRAVQRTAENDVSAEIAGIRAEQAAIKQMLEAIVAVKKTSEPSEKSPELQSGENTSSGKSEGAAKKAISGEMMKGMLSAFIGK